MKIVNATCYFTEDLERLWARIGETAVIAREHWVQVRTRGYIGGAREEPMVLRIGYYTTQAKKGTYDWCGYSNLRQRWTPNPRLGIVKKGKLPQHPLQALAEAALDYSLMPAEVVSDVASDMASLIGASGLISNEETKHFWTWLSTFKVRYRERAKRGSRKAVRKVREEIKLATLRREEEQAHSRIMTLRLELQWAERQLVAKRAEVATQKKAVDEF
jgi:hypothetical protein